MAHSSSSRSSRNSSRNSPNVASLSRELRNVTAQASEVASTAKSRGRDTTGITNEINRSNAMVAQTRRQGSTSFRGSDEEKTYNSNIITPASLAPNSPITLPNTPTPGYTPPLTLTSSPGLEALGTTVKDNQYVYDPTKSESYNAVAESNQSGRTNLNDYFSSLKGIQPVSQEEAYLKREKQAGILNLQGEVNNYTSQLNTISKNAQAQNLSLEGTGRGQTTSFIGGEQARINREAAIASLPISAQLDAAQGNLDSATARLDKLWAINQADVKQQYDFKKGVIDAVFSYASNSEQNILTARLADIKTKQDTTSANISRLQEWSKMAVQTGQSNLITQFTALDPKSPTFDRDFGLLQSKVVDPTVALDVAIKRSQLNALNTPKVPGAPEIKNFGTTESPIWKQWSGTGWTDVSGISNSKPANALASALALNDISNVSSILTNSAIGSVVGPSSLARTSPGLWGATKRFFTGALAGGVTGAGVGAIAGGLGAIPGAIIGALATGSVNASRGSMSQLTGNSQNFIGSVENMRAELTKDKLAQAKGEGVTFGALSDGERGLISQAATKIGTWAVTDTGTLDGKVTGYNIDEKSFKQEIDTINYFKKLDAVLQGSTPESVGAVRQADGKLYVANSDGTLSELILNR